MQEVDEIALPGFETIDLPPQTSRRIALGKALAAAAVGLRLSSEQKITAGVLSDNGGDAKATDLADNATGGKFGEQIDAAGQKADEAIGE